MMKEPDLFQNRLNQSYPPESGFNSRKEVNDFEDKAKLLLMSLRSELKGMYDIDYRKTASIRKAK